ESTLVGTHRRELRARQSDTRLRLKRRAQRERISSRRRDLPGREKVGDAAGPSDRDQASHGPTAVGDLDSFATFDLAKITARLLAELASPDRYPVRAIAPRCLFADG